MKAFWLASLLFLGALDYWCHTHHKETLTRSIVEAIPAIITLPLILWGFVHLAAYYYRRAGQ